VTTLLTAEAINVASHQESFFDDLVTRQFRWTVDESAEITDQDDILFIGTKQYTFI
jgi:hypothetical protein